MALASVIVLDPEVLLLDEPTAMLDPRSQSQLIDLIQNWKGSSKTVITATHQLEIVEDIADQVVVLEQGTAGAARSPKDILSNSELLLRANLVHAHRHKHGDVTHSHPHLHSQRPGTNTSTKARWLSLVVKAELHLHRAHEGIGPMRATEGVAVVELIALVGDVGADEAHHPVLAERLSHRQIERVVARQMVWGRRR